MSETESESDSESESESETDSETAARAARLSSERARRSLLGMRLAVGVIVVACLLAACDAPAADADAGAVDAFVMRPDAMFDPAAFVDAAAFEYEWSCTGEVAPPLVEPASEPSVEDCSAGLWPDLALELVCPTMTTATRTDPDTGMPLPPADARALPILIPVSESGSFLDPSAFPATWPRTLRVVAWNVEYSRGLDAQIEALTTHPELSRGELFLLSEVDRCSSRNGVRRAARALAEALGGAYVYGIEFVELSIGRTVGGDTGQAIVSRRPLRDASLLCHSSQFEWFADEGEPRLGTRVALSAEIPLGDTWARVHAVHFESNDALGERRVVQVKELLDTAQRDACERPQIVAGDFNTWYATAPERVVMRRAGFVDALEELGDTGSTHSSGRRLDYVYSRGFTIRAGAVERAVVASDHLPVWVDIELE